MGDMGDVEDHHPGSAVGNVGKISFDLGWTMERYARRWGLAPVDPLPGHPPAAHLDRIRRIVDIDDDVDVSAVARHSRGQVNVTPAKIAIAMRPAAPSVELPEQLRIDCVRETPNQDPFIVRSRRISTPTRWNPLEGGNHFVVLDFHLDRPGVRRSGNELNYPGARRLGNVHDGPPAIPQMSHVEIPVPLALLDRHLERRSPLDFRVGDDSNVPSDRPAWGLVRKNTAGEHRANREKPNYRRDNAVNALLVHARIPRFAVGPNIDQLGRQIGS